jgi:hypothetical protein
LISALFIFNITFLPSQQKERKKKRLPISGKQNTKGGRAVSKNKTAAGAGTPFFEK